MIDLLDFVQTRSLPAAVRLRIALDVAEASHGLGGKRPRATIATVQIDESGRAHTPACASHGHLATLLWEILASRLADTEDLPWSDPADDLPADVLDTFASLQLRPARDISELRRRFCAGVRPHAAAHDDVVRGVSPAPQAAAPITLRAPAIQIEALRTLSATEETAPRAAIPEPAPRTEDLIVTRVCKVVTMPQAEAQVEELPRSTLEPWDAPPLPSPNETSTVALEAEPPRRRRTWPVVAVSLAAALVLLGLAGRQRMAATVQTSPAAPPTASESQVALATPAPSQAVSTSTAPPSSSAPFAPASTEPPRRPVWATRAPPRRAAPLPTVPAVDDAPATPPSAPAPASSSDTPTLSE